MSSTTKTATVKRVALITNFIAAVIRSNAVCRLGIADLRAVQIRLPINIGRLVASVANYGFQMNGCWRRLRSFQTASDTTALSCNPIPTPPARNTTNARLGIGSDLCVICRVKQQCTNPSTHAWQQSRFFNTKFSLHIDPLILRTTWTFPTIMVKAPRLPVRLPQLLQTMSRRDGKGSAGKTAARAGRLQVTPRGK